MWDECAGPLGGQPSAILHAPPGPPPAPSLDAHLGYLGASQDPLSPGRPLASPSPVVLPSHLHPSAQGMSGVGTAL